MPEKSKEDRPLVVVIEDDGMVADALCLLIEDWGYLCRVASCPKVLARTLGKEIAKVRAMVVDYYLDDGFTGDKAADALTAAIGARVPTIITTAHTTLADRQTRYPVLPKPFNPDVLRSWLRANIDEVPAEAAP